jgi:NAD(P)-dependent dehydrogenase (short-subunit alcohol dehydrogenase family)
MKLNNKVAIVTGSQQGIGKAIALELAKEGARIVISDLDLEKSRKVTQEIKNIGSEALAIKCDVTKKEEVEKMVKDTVNEFQKIDILVNNAGVVIQKPFVEFTEDDWDFVIGVNLKGVFMVTQAVVKHMIEHKKGKILSIASIAGMIGYLNTSAYGASKAGIIDLTRDLALELASNQINVNAIAPGAIKTKMTEDILEEQETRENLLKNIPWGRVGRPEEIGKAAVFLVSSDSDYITGHTLVVDGGWVMH